MSRPDTITLDKRTEDLFVQGRTTTPQSHMAYVTELGEVRTYTGPAAQRRREEIEREEAR